MCSSRGAFILPDAAKTACTRAAAAGFLLVIRAAIVAGQFAHDLVGVGAAAGAHDLGALGFQITQAALGVLRLGGDVAALLGGAQGLGEEEVFVAVGFFQLTLTLLRDLIELAHFGFDLWQGLAGLRALLVFGDEALFELDADRIARHPLRAGLAWHASRRRSRSWNGRRRAD